MELFPKPPTGYIFFLYFFEYETIVRSSAWSFGHLDPDPSSALQCRHEQKEAEALH